MNDDTKSVEAPVAVEAPSAMSQEEISRLTDDIVAALKAAVAVPIKTWDERLTSALANRFLLQGNVRRDQRKEKVDKMAAAILLQSYLDSLAA